MTCVLDKRPVNAENSSHDFALIRRMWALVKSLCANQLRSGYRRTKTHVFIASLLAEMDQTSRNAFWGHQQLQHLLRVLHVLKVLEALERSAEKAAFESVE